MDPKGAKSRSHLLEGLLDAVLGLPKERQTPPGHDNAQSSELWRWRQRVFNAIFASAMLLGLLAFVPTAMASASKGLWHIVISYSLAYVAGFAILFLRFIPFAARAFLGLTLVYCIALYTLDTAGLWGSGRVWLFFFSLITFVILGLRAGLITLVLNLATLLFYLYQGYGKQQDWINLLQRIPHNSSWSITTGTFAFLNLLAVVSMALLVRALEEQLSKSRMLGAELETERLHLEESNRELKEEVRRREKAEEALEGHRDNLERLVAERTGQLLATNQALEREVVERKNAEDRLRLSASERQRILDGIGEGMLILEQKTLKVLEANRAACLMLGLDSDSLLGMSAQHILPAKDLPRVKKAMRLISGGAELPEGTFLLPKSCGQALAVDAAARAITFNGHTCVVVIMRDARRRLAMERALRESEQRLRLVLDSGSDGMWDFNMQTKEAYFGRNYWLSLGYGPGEMEPNSATVYSLIHPEDLEAVGRAMEDHFKGRAERFQAEFRMKDKQGGWRWILSRGRLVETTPEGLPLRFVGTQVDITDRKRGEQNLRQIAAGVAHNFNNVLMAISSNAQAAQDLLGAPNKDMREISGILQNVVQGAKDGGDMVKRLADYVSQPADAGEAWEVVDAAELAATAVSLTRTAGRAKPASGFTLRIDMEPGCLVRGSRGELMEVFLNLIKNAEEAMMGKGCLTLTSSRGGGMIELVFQDNGPGISREVMDDIFQPFFTTKGVRGRGLGLSSSRGIIRAHGGDITVESTLGGGAVFKVTLPESPLPGGAGKTVKELSPVAQNVLLVEDEYLVAVGMQMLLEKAGYSVGLAGSVKEASALLKKSLPTIVICDLGLPDGSAWDVAAELKGLTKGGPAAPMILVTGWSQDQFPQKRPPEAPEPAVVLQKPVTKEDLLEAMAEAADGGAGHPEKAAATL